MWLANQGAKNLVMTSKRGMRTGGQRKVIELLRSRGVNVSPSQIILHAILRCILALMYMVHLLHVPVTYTLVCVKMWRNL